MQNEHYYRQELQNKIEEFFENEADDNDFGWIGDNTVKLMTDAAWSVLMASVDVQEYMSKNDILK